MKKKKRGMTLIELILALAVTVLILGIVYPMFFSNNRTLSTAELNSDLQREAEKIEERLITIGIQSKGIKSVKSKLKTSIEIDGVTKELSKATLEQLIDNGILDNTSQTMKVDEIEFYSYDENGVSKVYKFLFDDKLGDLYVETNESKTLISTDIKSMEIKPVTLNSKETLEDVNAIQVIAELEKSKGYSDSNKTISTLIKFRNKK